MDLLITSIISIITETGKDIFKGIRGKIKLRLLKKRLREDLFDKILNKYGDTVYYNDLDQFLTRNNVLSSIIRNSTDSTVFEYKSQLQITNYYVQRFIEEHPRYRKYTFEIKSIICSCFKIIFNALNRMPDENARVVCNVVKELANNIETELDAIRQDLSAIDEKLDRILPRNTDEPQFNYEKYLKYLSCIFPSYDSTKYLQRKTYCEDNPEEKADILDILLKEKQVLLLGEAGFGKTYESVSLIHKLCLDERTKDLIPVFLPLQEYGSLYHSIWEGISYKIGPYSSGNIDELIEGFLHSGRLVLILDGIDDIVNDSDSAKFFVDAADFTAKFYDNLYFFSSRINRYRGQLSGKKKIFLTDLDEMTIRQELQKDGIFVEIPKSYYQLFANPLLFTIGKTVLKRGSGRRFFNRSQLFSELFQQLYGGIEHKKGITRSQLMTYSDTLLILGQFAYENNAQSSFSILEFDQKISRIVGKNSAAILSSLISSGIFLVTDKITFSHMLIKEFCIAFYLIYNYPLHENRDLYCRLIHNNEIREVFIFISGLFTDLSTQSEFLDFVMETNLSLYVECINSKSNITLSNKLSNNENAYRILSEIKDSYTFIVSNYFCPIADLFEPRESSRFPDRKTGIRGCLSNDGKTLDYWFDLIENSEPEVTCINSKDLLEQHNLFSTKAARDRRSIASFGINLELSGLSVESGRIIALDIIKKTLKAVIDKKLLHESSYLLCERITNWQRKIKPISNVNTLNEMSSLVDDLINRALQDNPNIRGFFYGKIDLLQVQSVLHRLCQADVNYSESILPGRDKSLSECETGWVWDLYSDAQKKDRIQKFFYFHQLSYLEMVQNNFPKLYNCFSRVLDSPYQSIVLLNNMHGQNKQSIFSEPRMTYYYVASDGPLVPLPQIIEIEEDFRFSEISSQIFNVISNSYLSQGRIAQQYSLTQTGFSFTLHSRGTGTHEPLSDYVYRSIKDSLEEVLGKI